MVTREDSLLWADETVLSESCFVVLEVRAETISREKRTGRLVIDHSWTQRGLWDIVRSDTGTHSTFGVFWRRVAEVDRWAI